MAQLAVSNEFLAAYATLPRPVRRAAEAALAKFSEHTHAGLHMEKLEGARDKRVRTIRVDRFYRGVVFALGGDNYVWHTIMPHDDAIAYAISRTVTVNQTLGVLEVRDQALIEGREATAPPPAAVGLFDAISDADLRRLGVDQALLPCIRAFTRDEQFEALAGVLPPAQYDVLAGLASGMAVEEVWQELAARIVTNVDPDDLMAAALRTPERIKFVSGPHELAAVLAHPFHVWRTFLHPIQHDVAYRTSFAGPAMVTGSAGTGKSVTAVHRARFLAGRLPNDGSKVLLTTFTNALAEALRAQLRLLTEDPLILDRIDVSTVDRLAFRIVEADRGRAPKVAEEPLLRKLWEQAAQDMPRHWTAAGTLGAYSATFLRREWEQVILAQRLSTVDQYRAASRRGRGEALRAPARDAVWEAISRAVAALARQHRQTHLQLAIEAAEATQRKGAPQYKHIVVDEGQDLHPAQWGLLRALVPRGPNDLFILADPHQRIYDSHVSLADMGIDVRGRSRRLTVNYRTTHEILDWSVKLLHGSEVVGLDDNTDTLAGYRSVTRGNTPGLTRHPDRDTELESLIEQVGTWLEQGVEPHAIGVAARTNRLVDTIAAALRRAYIPVADRASGAAGVCVATMHQLKGLEFQCLAVGALDAEVVPATYAVTAEADDRVSHRQDLQRERCLLFVAATRARDVLYLSHVGEPSSLLPV